MILTVITAVTVSTAALIGLVCLTMTSNTFHADGQPVETVSRKRLATVVHDDIPLPGDQVPDE
jgi:hypothetical protein